MNTTEPGERRARVFISCGQAKGTDEERIAAEIARRLQELGFDPYIAIQEQTLLGLKENIFARLENSEYYLFIDFKRERLVGLTSDAECRGSLFAHQELALASYLGIDVLAFQEEGIKKNDGIMQFIQANAIQFADRSMLPRVVADSIRRSDWNPNWRNELVLEREPGQFTDANKEMVIRTGPRPNDLSTRSFVGRHFHVDVRNRHRSKIATNCYAYISRIVNLGTNEENPFRTVELKWAGYVLPNAHILAGQVRRFDAFWIDTEHPAEVQFNLYADATDYIPRLRGAGRYRLTYQVVSDNFPSTSLSLLLNLNASLSLTTFEAET